MSQHDYVIDNGPGLAVRTDINAAIQALASQSSGPIEPTTPVAGMLWLDTSIAPDGLLRQRNLANTAWITPTAQPAAHGNIVQTVVTSSTTYNKPPGLRYLEVVLVGGSGAGAGAGATTAGQHSAGGGGGGAGVVRKFYAAADLSASQGITIGSAGAPGAAGAAGGPGGNSIFKALTAAGGNGGIVSVASSAYGLAGGGSGGSAAGGDLNHPGGRGGTGVRMISTLLSQRGRGGASVMGAIEDYAPTASSQSGDAGNPYGIGGSGSTCGESAAARTGGAGIAGICILKEYF